MLKEWPKGGASLINNFTEKEVHAIHPVHWVFLSAKLTHDTLLAKIAFRVLRNNMCNILVTGGGGGCFSLRVEFGVGEGG